MNALNNHIALEVTSNPFQLSTAEGQSIKGQIDTPLAGVIGRCILLPAFGLTTQDLNAMSYYLLINGFEVIRFDPTCHVGISDGEVAHFKLSQFAADIETVVNSLANRQTCVISISLSCRPALRVIAKAALKGLFLLSPVVNARQTLHEVCGEDLIGQYLDGTAPASYSILGMTVARAFCKDCVEKEFDSLASTLMEASSIETPTRVIAGSEDRWVALEEVAQLAAAMPSCKLIKLDGANHQMFRSPVIFQAYLKVLLHELFIAYEVQSEPDLPRFSEVVRYINGIKREQKAAAAICG
ncbi:MAG: hypothetical protein QM749_00825 [Aquabacterium sp.]